MLDLLGAVAFGILAVVIYHKARPRVKPPVVPQPLPKIELKQVGPPAHSTRYRFPKSQYERIDLTQKERFFILNRDKRTCQLCGKKAPEVVLEVDHIFPVSKGGTNDPSNLQALCLDCNRGKGVDLLPEM